MDQRGLGPTDQLGRLPPEHASRRRRHPRDHTVAFGSDHHVQRVLGDEPIARLRVGQRRRGGALVGHVAPRIAQCIADPHDSQVEVAAFTGCITDGPECVQHQRLARLEHAHIPSEQPVSLVARPDDAHPGADQLLLRTAQRLACRAVSVAEHEVDNDSRGITDGLERDVGVHEGVQRRRQTRPLPPQCIKCPPLPLDVAAARDVADDRTAVFDEWSHDDRHRAVRPVTPLKSHLDRGRRTCPCLLPCGQGDLAILRMHEVDGRTPDQLVSAPAQ